MAKGTDKFKATIEAYLKKLSKIDLVFAERLKKENKNIEGCIDYILTQVKNSGKQGFEDDEIFGMAIHYYDEDELKDEKGLTPKIVMNHEVELTAEEIAEAKEKAKQEVFDKETKRLTKTPVKIKPKAEVKEKTNQENTLF